MVLLVEDDDGDALLVEELVADGLPGARVVRARSLDEARRFAPAAECVVLDLGLPDATGTEGVVALLDLAGHLAIVVLTGADSEAMGAAALAAGAQDYLVKSRVEPDSLARSIRYALARRRAADAAHRLADAERRRRENARMERALLRDPLVISDDTHLTIHYRPARDGAELGGDFYDAVEDEGGSLHVVVGDVCGHGPDEAALGARLRSAWRALVLAGLDPDTVLVTLEAVLRSERDDDAMFATLCQASFGRERDCVELRLAGHPPPFLLSEDGAAPVPAAGGVLLGPFPGAHRRATAVPLGRTWRLLLYTDGLIEGRARPDAPQRLGAAAVATILGGLVARGLDGDDLLTGLLSEVELANGEALADDVALCLVAGRSRA